MKHQQKSKPGSRATREEIIAEYLTGVYSYRELGAKHDIPHRSICDWVRESQGRKESWRDKTKRLNQLAKEHTPDVPKEVSLLQAELRKSKLQNKLLQEILRLSEEYTGIELRKKYGTKRS